jgi:hypothetical protein
MTQIMIRNRDKTFLEVKTLTKHISQFENHPNIKKSEKEVLLVKKTGYRKKLFMYQRRKCRNYPGSLFTCGG